MWDVYNNSSEKELEFIVDKKEDLKIKHILNYPNPFSTSTGFYLNTINLIRN